MVLINFILLNLTFVINNLTIQIFEKINYSLL